MRQVREKIRRLPPRELHEWSLSKFEACYVQGIIYWLPRAARKVCQDGPYFSMLIDRLQKQLILQVKLERKQQHWASLLLLALQFTYDPVECWVESICPALCALRRIVRTFRSRGCICVGLTITVSCLDHSALLTCQDQARDRQPSSSPDPRFLTSICESSPNL